MADVWEVRYIFAMKFQSGLFSGLFPKVGILGGGQLSLMLAAASRRMGVETIVLAESSDAPAARWGGPSVFGSGKDVKVLNWFFFQTELVTFENEFVNCDL